MATKFWNVSTGEYGPMILLGNVPNAAIAFWNGSSSGKDVAYAQEYLDKLIRPDVTPDLIMLNLGHTQDAGQPLATQVQPLITQLRNKYPKAQITVIKQNPGLGSDSTQLLSGDAAAMDAEGIQVIDVYSAFPTDAVALRTVMVDTVSPNAAGQKLWTKTVLAAFGLPAAQ